jgi:sulfur carrier protein ThiS
MRIYLGGQFSFYISGHPRHVDVELNEPTRLIEVLDRLGIPAAEVHVASVNGEAVNLQEVWVQPDDEVKLFPPVGGG